jgi:glucose-1-phosphate cytidylyltransferase
VIKRYFLDYDECLSNDFVLSDGGRRLELHSRDIEQLAHHLRRHGTQRHVGQRLKAVEPYLEDAETFMANYADGLSDLPLPEYPRVRPPSGLHRQLRVRATNQTFHVVSTGPDDLVSGIRHVADGGMWINGGFFVFTRDIFRYIGPGEELVEEPFHRLIAERQLLGIGTKDSGLSRHVQDKQASNDRVARGDTPWEVWKTSRHAAGLTAPAW